MYGRSKLNPKGWITASMSIVMFSTLLFSATIVANVNPVQAASLPINPNASQEARNLLSYMYSLEGNHILSGQHDFLESPNEYVEQIKTNTGKYPAIHGYEMGPIKGQTESVAASQRQGVVNSAIAWHNAGGIVTMMYHQNKPGTGYCWSGCVQPGITAAEFNTILTPGTPQNTALISEIDKVAVYLKQLRDAGVPVLWRPYHEMNGGWFWWGGQTDFWKLWDLMYDRYTNFHGLNNLIWVWNPNAPNSSVGAYSAYFPGVNKVDVLAVDIYNNDFQQTYHDQLYQLGQGKLISIGESGQHPNPSTLSTTQNKYNWFMTWGERLVTENTWASTINLYNHSWVITRDEVNIPSGSSDTQAPTVPANLNSPGKTDTTVNLSWTASTDNVGVAGYDVYNGSAKVNTANIVATNYTVTGLTPSTAYEFTGKAKDAAGNQSASSAALSVTTNVSSGPSFVKGINFNGGAVTINGNNWLAESSAGLTLSTILRASTSLTPNPAVDSATSNMLNKGIYSGGNFSVDQSLSNGSYSIYVWAIENYISYYRSFNIKLEGTQVTPSPIGNLPLNSWIRYGPYPVTVNDGILDMDVVKVTGDTHLMGMEIYAAGADTQAPSIPANLASPSHTDTTVNLSWTASTDNVGVAGYDVYNGAAKVNSSLIAGTSYTVTGLTAGTTYSFTVKAKDAAGNESASSNSLAVTTAPSITIVNDATTGTGLNQFEYSGTWNTSTGTGKYNNDDHYSLVTNSYYQVRFSGTQISIYASKASHHGIAAVSIDGGAETDVDFYAATRQDNVLIWTSPTLTTGTHTLKVRVKGTKNSASTGYVIVADRVNISY